MSKQMNSADAAALIYGSPGTKVIDRNGDAIYVDSPGRLRRIDMRHTSERDVIDGCSLESCRGPFTIPADPADPDELPEDVCTAIVMSGWDAASSRIIEALWKHIKPEAKR